MSSARREAFLPSPAIAAPEETARAPMSSERFWAIAFVLPYMVVFALFVVYLFRRLGAARRIGRALAAAGDPIAARVRPLAWGLTAALVGTIAANAFYLTMQFYYFYALALLALATPIVFARRLES